MRSGRLPLFLLLAALASCVSARPQHFGQYADFAPQVSATKGEKIPRHVTVQLGRAANVAVFLVTPGRGTRLLYPSDSTQSQRLDAGSHALETSLLKVQASADSMRNNRPRTMGSRNGFPGRNGLDTSYDAPMEDGFLLVYASDQPLPYSAIVSRVVTRSIPIDDNEALNTVTKLIREATGITGTWAASAVEFP